MLKIKRVTIKDVWNEKNFKLDFDEELNIILGQNGIGKSTFLEIISSCLHVDLEKLSQYIFSEIEIVFFDCNKIEEKIILKKIYLNDEYNSYDYSYKYSVFGKEFQINSREFVRYYSRRTEDEKTQIKNEIKEKVSVDTLGIDRISNLDQLNRSEKLNHIDYKLEKLKVDLEKYKLVLENECMHNTKEFQKKVLELLMFNKDWDDENSREINFDIFQIEKNLRETYIEFGFSKIDAEKKVEAFMKDMITDRKKNVKKSNFDVLRSLLYRTNEVVIKLIELRNSKERINKPLIELIETLEKYISDKKFIFTLKGEFKVYKDEKEISLNELSSGEKQLLIFFIQVTLQRGKNVIYILDEPEISLHIGWQRNLLESIMILNSNCQVIVATHSPEISSNWRPFRKHIEVENINEV